jgi:ribonucleases P/MRP protein subunit RPP40
MTEITCNLPANNSMVILNLLGRLCGYSSCKIQQKLSGQVNYWLSFNAPQCSENFLFFLVHGCNNVGASYMMNGTVLQDVKEEQDLGVVIQDNLKCAKLCAKVVTKANRTLAMIKRNFSNFSDEVVLRLYKSLVRPQLEYAVQAWRPHLKKDIDSTEGVHRRATNLVHYLRGFQYEDRLRALHLTTLETRRLKGDLIEVFKIFKGLDKL